MADEDDFSTVYEWADAGLTALAVGELDDVETALREIRDMSEEDDE